MTFRAIQHLIPACETSDGEGVSICRSLGLSHLGDSDPFLLLDEFYSQSADNTAGFPDHPHRGFSTLTYMLKGRMAHADNQGNKGRVGPGGFQWMTAGKGIIHSERPEPERDGMRGLQLWVNLPGKLKMRDPFYINGEAGDVPEIKEEAATIRVLAGKFAGEEGPLRDPVTGLHYLDVYLKAGGIAEIPLPEDHRAFIYVADGEVRVQGERSDAVPAGHAALLGPGEAVKLAAGEKDSRLIAVSGTPIREPVARHGPFVMNTRAEIEQAIADFQRGAF